MSENTNPEDDLFEEALLKTSGPERAAFLEGACRNDHELRARVERMIDGHLNADGFLQALPERTPPPPGTASPTEITSLEQVGSIIGSYKLLQKIGEGGCGVVYVAEQEKPVRRRVALKVIKLGMDTRSVIARFEAERQALAMMDHPNIAKVLDAGATGAGRPYFVMELVKGIRITDYCDQNDLTTDDRLDLFTQVCHAIQHAHQKGIIHRDIKPSNVLVTSHDGVPVPKVIDFGIAKATQGRLTDLTIYTELNQFIGTPAYMSPEQAEMSGLDIDTRTDIYALGVLLYELLTGTTPFDGRELLAAGLDAMRRTIREKEPARPSTRLSTMLDADRTTLAQHRQTDSRKLTGQLCGDLDWIVMKCLEKDRIRRYETANGLAADLKRHLNNEPVVARPTSAAYKFQKAFRRNKLAFAAGAAVAAALVVGITVSSWQMLAARRARNNEVTQRTKAEASEKLAAASATQAQASARDATASLYGSLLGQARATRIARQVGYREEVFGLLRQARDLDTPAKQLAALRLEAVASMGDFVGFRPRQLASAPGTNQFSGMRLSPDGRLLALRDWSGGIHLRELPSGREVGRWQTELRAWDLVFNGAGDRLLSVHVPEASLNSKPMPERMAGSRVAEFAPDLTGKWQQTGWRPMPGAYGCVSLSNAVFVVVADGWPRRRIHLVESGSWQTVHSLQRSEGSWEPIVAATRDGQKLALIWNADSSRPEPEIEIWDLPRQQLILRLPGRFNAYVSLAFSEDGRYLLTLAPEGTRIYETTNFTLLDEFTGFAAGYCFGSFLPGRSLLAVPRPHQGRLLIRNYQKHETEAVFDTSGPISTAAFAPGGEFLVTCSGTEVNLYPFAGADECLTLAGHPVSVPGIAFSPDGTRLASVSKDRTVRMWHAGTGQRIWEGDRLLPGPGQAVGFSPDGKLLATGDQETPLVQLWDVESGRQLLQLTNAVTQSTWSLQFVADPRHGLLLVRGGGRSGTTQDGVCAWSIGSTREVLDREKGAVRWLGSRSSGFSVGLVASPDGKRIAFVTGANAAQAGKFSTIVQDALGERPPVTLAPNTTEWEVQPLSFTPDGQSVAVRNTENRVAVCGVATGELRRSFALTGSSDDHGRLALSATGRWLAASLSKRGVGIYDFATGELRYALPEREGSIYWLAWHPQEPRLAIARDNGDIALWDVAKIDRQLAELGLGFASEPADATPEKNKP